MSLPNSEKEYQEFIARFEEAGFSNEEWHHAQHVAMAFWYLIRLDEDAAIDRIRKGILHLNSKHGVPQTPTRGYHETWTIFFSKILKQYIESGLDRSLPLIDQMNAAILFLKDFREITRAYYSKDLIMSWEARTTWVAPDLKPLPQTDP